MFTYKIFLYKYTFTYILNFYTKKSLTHPYISKRGKTRENVLRKLFPHRNLETNTHVVDYVKY